MGRFAEPGYQQLHDALKSAVALVAEADRAAGNDLSDTLDWIDTPVAASPGAPGYLADLRSRRTSLTEAARRALHAQPNLPDVQAALDAIDADRQPERAM